MKKNIIQKALIIGTFMLLISCNDKTDNTSSTTKLASMEIASKVSKNSDNYLGAWKIYNTSTHKHKNGVIAIFKSKINKDKYEIFVAEGPGHSDSNFSCVATVKNPGNFSYLLCDSEILIGLVINEAASKCNQLKLNGDTDILSYTDAQKHSSLPSICYTIYKDVGPGPGSGTAGNSGP
jgi:hypothetical protein